MLDSNKEYIENYKTSLFVVCLDRPVTLGSGLTREDENMRQALHGGGTSLNAINRWFDKTLQVIYKKFKNTFLFKFYFNTDGYAGLNYEHSPAEGPPFATLLDFIFDQLCVCNLFIEYEIF